MEEKTGYRKLIVWQKADELAHLVYMNTKDFPKDEIYGIISQLRRAALSIPTNIVEGYGRQGKKGRENMYPSVSKVVPNEDFTLAIVFDNGEDGILDMKPYLGFGVFQKIREYEHFKRVRIAFDTIEWDGGMDLDPEFVYGKCKMTTHA